MFLVTNDIVIQDFGVLRRAIDAESRDLAILLICPGLGTEHPVFFRIIGVGGMGAAYSIKFWPTCRYINIADTCKTGKA